MITLFSFCPTLEAQKRSDRVRRKYAHILNNAQSAYQNYHFTEAGESLEKYKKQLRRRRVRLNEGALSLEAKIKRAKHFLTYAERIQLIDSVRFDKLDITAVFADRSPRLAKMLKFKVDSTGIAVSYNNDYNNTSLLSNASDESKDLFQIDTLLNGVVIEYKLSETINTPEEENSPFLLNTGYTLLFARQAELGLGGYDLYYARYNNESKSYYKAKNLGMPFNSLSNDYLLAYDEDQNVSYLLSDRYCPKDSLVLYRFEGLPNVISDKRVFQNDKGGSVDTVANLKGQFMHQVDSLFVVPSKCKEKANEIYLPLSNGVVIRSWKEFRSAEAMSLYRDVIVLKEELQTEEAYQKELRLRYKDGEKSLDKDLLRLEQEIRSLKIELKNRLTDSKNKEITYRSK